MESYIFFEKVLVPKKEFKKVCNLFKIKYPKINKTFGCLEIQTSQELFDNMFLCGLVSSSIGFIKIG